MTNEVFQSHGGGQAVLREKKIVVQDADGNDIVTFGRLDDGVYGIEIRDAAGGLVYKVTNSGQAAPYQVLAAGSNSSDLSIPIPSAVYTSNAEFFCDFWCTGEQLSFYYLAVCPVGTTMAVKVQVTEFGGTTTVLQEDLAVTTTGFVLVEQLMPSDAVGKFFRFEMFGRTVSGAGPALLGMGTQPVNRPA